MTISFDTPNIFFIFFKNKKKNERLDCQNISNALLNDDAILHFSQNSQGGIVEQSVPIYYNFYHFFQTIPGLPTNGTEDLFGNLSKLLQSTAALLKNIAETKGNAIKSIGPVIDTAVSIKKGLIENDSLRGIVKTKTAVVKTLAESAPQIGSLVGGLTSSVPSLLKMGLCGLICPLQSGEAKITCQKDHCDNRIEPRNLDDQYDEDAFGDYATS